MTNGDQHVLVFDVNDTISDMRAMGPVFQEVGVPGELAATWFASILREGFALAVHGESRPFAVLGHDVARMLFAVHPPNRDPEDAVAHVLDGVQRLPVHADVRSGVEALAAAGHRLVLLTNGSAETAEGLLERGGVRQHFEDVLSVEEAPCWKPASEAYRWASTVWEVPVDRMTMVAVHPWDLHGASRAGMRTAWIDRYGAPYPAYARSPDLRVSDLTQLAGRLSGDNAALRD